MAEFTKGEWKIKRRILADGDLSIQIITDTGNQYGVIATVGINKQANADLIASAPVLYEALKEADVVICQLCKRLNPQHTSSPYHERCKWCGERDSRLKALSLADGKDNQQEALLNKISKLPLITEINLADGKEVKC